MKLATTVAGFILNGGAQTLASYEGHEEEFEDDRRWMSSLPTSYEDELRIFVHAGIIPSQAFADQTDHTKMGFVTLSNDRRE